MYSYRDNEEQQEQLRQKPKRYGRERVKGVPCDASGQTIGAFCVITERQQHWALPWSPVGLGHPLKCLLQKFDITAPVPGDICLLLVAHMPISNTICHDPHIYMLAKPIN